ncbi:hypothetical protein ACP4OV_012864 [Aristida adscensionis]
MAKFIAAAGLVVLMSILLVTGQALTLEQMAMTWYPEGSRPQPVRIYCKQNTALNVGTRDNAVVLVTANDLDTSQIWYPVIPPLLPVESAGLKNFSLVNAQTYQVMVIPSGSTQQVTLTNDFDTVKILDQLWTPGTPIRDGFYEIKVANNPSMTLNGLYGSVHDGTPVGIFPSTPEADNTLWNLTSIFPLGESMPRGC